MTHVSVLVWQCPLLLWLPFGWCILWPPDTSGKEEGKQKKSRDGLENQVTHTPCSRRPAPAVWGRSKCLGYGVTVNLKLTTASLPMTNLWGGREFNLKFPGLPKRINQSLHRVAINIKVSMPDTEASDSKQWALIFSPSFPSGNITILKMAERTHIALTW